MISKFKVTGSLFVTFHISDCIRVIGDILVYISKLLKSRIQIRYNKFERICGSCVNLRGEMFIQK